MLADTICSSLSQLEASASASSPSTAGPGLGFDPQAQARKNLTARASKLRHAVRQREPPVDAVAKCGVVQSRLNSRMQSDAGNDEIIAMEECHRALLALVALLQQIQERLGEETEASVEAEGASRKALGAGLPMPLRIILMQFELLARFFNKYLRRQREGRAVDPGGALQRSAEDEAVLQEVRRFWGKADPADFVDVDGEEICSQPPPMVDW